MSNNGRLISVVSFLITAAVFLILASVAIVWASGISYDVKTKKITQTGIISVGESLKTAEIYLNGSLVATETPYDIRGLVAGDYKLEITKEGHQACSKTYKLSEAEVVDVEPALVAVSPRITQLTLENSPSYLDRSNFDFGLSVLSGELLDYGSLVARFSVDPLQVHRFGDYYIYQSGQNLRFLDLGCGTDQVIYSSTSNEKIKFIQRPASWTIYVYEGSVVQRINLHESTEATASL